MQRKLMVLLAVFVILNLVIAPVGSAQAQDSKPPQRLATPLTPPHDSPVSSLKNYGDIGKGLIPLASDVSAQALTLGVPGLSFRYVQTLGTSNEPYLADGTHLYGPNGLFIDASDTLFVTEERGSRVLAYNSAGANTMILGHAGQPWGHDDFLSTPKDVAKDAAGNIWIVFNYAALKEFDPTGATVIQSYPATNNWETGSTNDHFNDPRGIAFNTDGLMFVSDAYNHRVQIYDVSGATPAYVSTIGVTGVPQSDSTGFNEPGKIAFDSLGRLYVVDTANYRVQRCTSSTPWITWTCSVFLGETGVAGNDLTHIDWSYGIEIDSNDNIFVADGSNYRVLKCNVNGSCQHFAGTNGVPGTDIAHFRWTADVGIDSSGNVYISDFDNHRVQKFNSVGVYQSTVGTAGVPYLSDNSHFNKPWGIALAPDNSMYILENSGYRLIKLNSSGVFQWSVGEAGVYGSDNAHLGNWWAGVEGSPAIDANGRIYVGDTGNDRVQIFNSNGSYYATLGSWGTGNYEFACPTDISISPLNGDIYVSDHCNHRIQVFTAGLVYKATLGATGTSGSDNLHFNYPYGVTVDNSGNIFVADHDNHRVQKCALLAGAPGFSCSTFAGETGVSASDYGHLGGPIAVKVDSAGRVYVADEWNSRVQVFDASGAYLTTIGGAWGTNSGEMISPSGLALDGSGNVYVTDRDNNRIQKFTPGVPGWMQSNLNGFGDVTNSNIFSMTTFNNQLYAGTENGTTGGQIWRSSDGVAWASAMTNGFGDATNLGIDDLLVFNNQLYAGTYNWDIVNNQTTGGQLWRSSDGVTWNQLALTGFDPLTNAEFFLLESYNAQIYASTWPDGSTHGGEIWRSATGNSNDWTQVESNGFGDINNFVGAFAGYNNNFYVGTYNGISGAEMWRSPSGNGGTWVQVNTDGFGDPGNYGVSALTSFNGYLYAATGHINTGGAEVWRCQICNGSDWTQIVDNGFGNVDSRRMPALEISNGRLYLVVGNNVTGLEVWHTINGTAWVKVATDGFGTTNNKATYWDNSVTTFGGKLYIGTLNWANGGQIWGLLSTFADVPYSYWANSFIERLYNAGVTGGCGAGAYCPESIVTRAQMAVFLLRGKYGPSYTPPAVGASTGFTDVPVGYWAAAWIKQLAAEGITGGCGPGVYCPDVTVTRAQMAIFLLRAEHGPVYTPPAPTGVFTDVPVGHWADKWIEQLAVEGITGGCGVGVYCPETAVTRAQMAVFLVKTFNLP